MIGGGHRGWRVLGAVLVGTAFLPLHRLLDPARAGPAAASTRAQLDAVLAQAWTGTAAVLAIAALVVVLVGLRMRSLRADGSGDGSEASPPFHPHPWETATARGLTGVSERAWIAGCAILAGGITAAVSRWLLGGRPTLADEVIQLRHARLLAAGRLADPWPLDAAFRNSVNGVWTPEGWTSIYPPGHTALLAAATRLGAVEWLGPLLTAITVGFTAALVLRLLPERPTTARVAAVAVALSPFVWGIGAGFLSHAGAACAVSVALWSAVRARDGGTGWALLTGAAAGWAVASRPWTGLVLAVALPLGVWVARVVRERRSLPPLRLHRLDDPPPPPRFGPRDVLLRAGAAAAGGAPFAVLLAWWNTRLFGSPLRFGYTAAFGPAHGLGFHRDPWGNSYGITEAVAYTGSDVALLGLHLFETPVPAVAAVGAWLLLRGRPFPGSGLFLAWALAAVAANVAYWHHGIHFGPRMLYEAGPAWIVLTVLAAVGLGLPRGTLGAPTPDEAAAPAPPWAVVAVARVATVVALGWGLALGLPPRLGSWALPPLDDLPDPGPGPSLVFVHGSWAGREAARLEATGMRRDSVETALRRNDLCRVHAYASARRIGAPLPPLDLEPAPGSPSTLAAVELSEGNRARIDPAAAWPSECVREARSDREGTVELAPVLARVPWTGDDGPVVWVRDLGPAENRAALEAFPDRAPRVWVAGGLESYDEAMDRLWGPGP